MAYASAAQKYRAAGWSSPLPITKDGAAKAPVPVGYTGRHAVVPSNETIDTWSKNLGSNNLAIHLPPNVIGLDVDSGYGSKVGDASLADLVARFGPLPPTYRSTARGSDNAGGIFLYLVTEGSEFPGIIAPSVECIQWKHRYVVAHPSIHPAGGTYTWYGPDGEPCDIPNADDLPFLPAAWIRGLQEAQSNNVSKATLSAGSVVDALRRLPEGELCAAVSERLERALEDTNTGGDARHDRMLQHQTALVRLGSEGHLGVMDALTELQQAFVASIADRTGQDDAQGEYDRALSGAVALIEAKPSIAGEDPCSDEEETADDFEEKVAKELERMEIKSEAQARFMAKRSGELEVPELMTSWDASLIVGDGVEWAIDGLIPRNGVALLMAEKKAGKTTLTHKIIQAINDETKLFGTLQGHKTRGSIVLYDFEMPTPQLGEWIARNGIARKEGIYVTSMQGRPKDFALTNPTHRAKIVESLKAVDCSFLVLDPAGPYFRALGADEQSNTEMGIAFDAILALKVEAGIDTVLVSVHAGHGEKGRARGASVLMDIPDVLLSLRLVGPGSPVRTFSATGRDVDVDTISFQYDLVTGVLEVVDDKVAKEQSRHDDAGHVLRYLDAAPGASTNQIVKALTNLIDGCGDTRAKHAIAQAVKLGFVTTEKDGTTRTATVKHLMTEAGQTELRNTRIANGESV